jgi:hypothetical protein
VVALDAGVGAYLANQRVWYQIRDPAIAMTAGTRVRRTTDVRGRRAAGQDMRARRALDRCPVAPDRVHQGGGGGVCDPTSGSA